jgi:hypothetical protein
LARGLAVAACSLSGGVDSTDLGLVQRRCAEHPADPDFWEDLTKEVPELGREVFTDVKSVPWRHPWIEPGRGVWRGKDHCAAGTSDTRDLTG